MKFPNLSNVAGVIKMGKAFVLTHRPELLFGASVATTVGSVVMAAKGGYEARGIIDDAKADRMDTLGQEEYTPLTVKEKIQLTWPCYVPAAVGTVSAVGATTGLHWVHIKEKKALATAALAAIDEVKGESKAYLENLKESIKENVDDDVAEDIEKTFDDKVKAFDLPWMEDIYPVLDAKTGRPIWSNRVKIEDALNHTNDYINSNGDVSLNHFYEMAGFEPIPEGDDVGWSGEFIELVWDDVHTENGMPARRFKFRRAPKSGFSDFR